MNSLSDSAADDIVEQLLTGKMRNLGMNQAEAFAKELSEGFLNAEVVKFKERLDQQNCMKRLVHLKRHSLTMLRRVVETRQRFGLNVESDLRELEKLQTSFKEEDKRRVQVLAAEEARAAAASDDPTFVRPSRSANRGAGKKGSVAHVGDRMSGLIPADLEAYMDGELEGMVSKEIENGAFAPTGTAVSSSGAPMSVSSTANASGAPVDENSSAALKKRKRSSDVGDVESKKSAEDLQPFLATAGGGDVASTDEQAPKSKKAKTGASRKDQKAANAALSLPIDTFSLFKIVYKTLSANAPAATSLDKLVAEVAAEPRISLPLPSHIDLETLTALALIFLANPVSAVASVPCPKITAQSSPGHWSFLPQQTGAADVPSVVVQRLERFEAVFWLAVTRGQYDLAKQEITWTTLNKMLTGRAPSTIADIHTSVDRLSFQQQEPHRYNVSDHAFEYVFVAPDGTTKFRAIVPPCKAQRGRESNMIKAEHPPAVNLLTIVRDGVSKLPGGVGIRQDIPQLVKDSQYLIQDPDSVSEQQINQVISSCLDRIQAEIDSPLKYDHDLKLWIYQHRQRTVSDYDSYWAKLKKLDSQGETGDSAK